LSQDDATQFSQRLIKDYQLKVPEVVITSVLEGQPKIKPLLSRASFRQDAVQTPERVRRIHRRERRNFLRNVLVLAAAAVPALLGIKAGFFSPPAQIPSYVSGSGSGSQVTGGRLLTNAQDISTGQSITLNDPSLGPFLLIHLTTGGFAAYSAICTHAGCQVQFDPSAQQIACPCHGAVFDPYNSARVLAGPAPVPLQRVPITYDQSTGNIYLQ
jgi:nitrite reductase/ring-hydroxylating ferredoxin subunit